MLGVAVVFESIAFTIALRELLAATREESLWQAALRSKDPAVFVVLFEDFAALLGLLVAFLGIFFAHRLGNPSLDGVASLIIGLILAAVAILLAYESRKLLLGESSDLVVAVDRLEKTIRERHPEIKRIFIEAESLVRSKS